MGSLPKAFSIDLPRLFSGATSLATDCIVGIVISEEIPFEVSLGGREVVESPRVFTVRYKFASRSYLPFYFVLCSPHPFLTPFLICIFSPLSLLSFIRSLQRYTSLYPLPYHGSEDICLPARVCVCVWMCFFTCKCTCMMRACLTQIVFVTSHPRFVLLPLYTCRFSLFLFILLHSLAFPLSNTISLHTLSLFSLSPFITVNRTWKRYKQVFTANKIKKKMREQESK